MKLEKRKLEQIEPIPMKLTRKHRIHIAWTCSNGAHHEHRTKFGAWLCGRRQAISAFFNRKEITGDLVTIQDTLNRWVALVTEKNLLNRDQILTMLSIHLIRGGTFRQWLKNWDFESAEPSAPPDSITEIDKLKAYLEPGDEIIEAGCNSAGYYLKCSNGKLVMACINGAYPVEPVGVPKIAFGYQSVLAIGRWK